MIGRRSPAQSLLPLVLGVFIVGLVAGCSSDEKSPSGPATEAMDADCSWADDVRDWRGSGSPLFIADANLLTPYRMRLDGVSPHDRDDEGGEPDLEFTPDKAVRGGLRLAVLEILVTSTELERPDPFEDLLGELGSVRDELTSRGSLEIVRSPADVLTRQASGGEQPPPAIVLGVENLAPVASDLDRLDILYERGIRLATPVHSRPNPFGDSSYSQDRPHGGLSELGKRLVRRMNRLGLIIDVSHMSDETLRDTALVSDAPILASHSGVRQFTPGWERNLSDETIRSIAATGGVVHIPFSGSFLSQRIKEAEQPIWDHVEAQGLSINSLVGRDEARAFRAREGIAYAGVEDVVRQIDYVVDLVGIDHVGIGSSFDGSGESMVADVKDAGGYPRLVRGLCEAGYSPAAVEKIAGRNFLRAWSDVDRVSENSALAR